MPSILAAQQQLFSGVTQQSHQQQQQNNSNSPKSTTTAHLSEIIANSAASIIQNRSQFLSNLDSVLFNTVTSSLANLALSKPSADSITDSTNQQEGLNLGKPIFRS